MPSWKNNYLVRSCWRRMEHAEEEDEVSWASFAEYVALLPGRVLKGVPRAKFFQRVVTKYEMDTPERFKDALPVLFRKSHRLLKACDIRQPNKPSTAEGCELRKIDDGDEAATMLGMMFSNGAGIRANIQRAHAFFLLAAKAGYPTAMTELGLLYCKRAQQLGDSSPKHKTMIRRTVKLLSQATDLGDPKAMVKLALLYEEGAATEGGRDLSKAKLLYEAASKHGYVEGDYNLALLYEAGLYVARDDSVACRYYLVAAEAGHSGALSNLGVMYERGRGMDTNPRKAFDCYQKAAKKGHVLGFYNLALIYEKAKGGVVVKNEKKAFKLFKKAASRGYLEAQIKVGYMYSIGRGVKLDSQRSCEWYIRPAIKQQSFACANLGSMYLKGKGVAEDFAKAHQLLGYSAAKGHQRARQWLTRNPAVPISQTQT